MEIKDGWIVVIAIVAFGLGFGFGIAAAIDNVSGHCNTVHAFDGNHGVYECHAHEPEGQPK